MEPKLRVRSSGHGGSGYKHPHTGEIVPGVTTVLKKLEKPAIVQWAVDNTAAYAVANIDGLLSRTEEQGYGFLRWYWKRDPLKGDLDDIRNYSNGVLNDVAELGTMVHDWIAAETDHGFPYPDTAMAPDHFWEMVQQWETWRDAHDIQSVFTEVTVWNEEHGYAGTADAVWIIDGKMTLVDIKTSRSTWDEHWMQAVALDKCEYALVENGEGWVKEPMPKIDQIALLHIRPSDTDKNGNPMFPFAELKVLDMEEYDSLWRGFKGLLDVTHALSNLKKIRSKK